MVTTSQNPFVMVLALSVTPAAQVKVPIGVVQVREVVRVADVFGGEPGVNSSSELDHFLLLGLLHAFDFGLDRLLERVNIRKIAH